MGEPEALLAIRNGRVEINKKWYKVEKQPSGSCDHCYFFGGESCPDLARHICCTGGNILKEEDTERFDILSHFR